MPREGSKKATLDQIFLIDKLLQEHIRIVDEDTAVYINKQSDDTLVLKVNKELGIDTTTKPMVARIRNQRYGKLNKRGSPDAGSELVCELEKKIADLERRLEKLTGRVNTLSNSLHYQKR